MGAFEYVAVDAAGRERKGVLEGDTPRQVRQLLREQDLLPVAVDEVAASRRPQRASAVHLQVPARPERRRPRAGHAPARDAGQVRRCRSRRRCSRSRSRPTSRACAASCSACARRSWRATRWPTASATSRARSRDLPRHRRGGEQSGHLDAVLERLADYTENRQQLRSRTLSAMLYPVLLFVVCMVIVFFLLVSVVPKVVEVFRPARPSCRCSPRR